MMMMRRKQIPTQNKTKSQPSPPKRSLQVPSENEDETLYSTSLGYFHCYCLRSEHPQHPNKTYVGFTTNPYRRLRQHNGITKGGAWRTNRGGRPWAFAAIVQGFANKIVALQFEWAWQHCDKSLAVRAVIGDDQAKKLRRKRGVAGQLAMLKTLIEQCGDLYGKEHLTVYFFDPKHKNIYDKAVLMPSLKEECDAFVTMTKTTFLVIDSVEVMPFYAARNQGKSGKKIAKKQSTPLQIETTTSSTGKSPNEIPIKTSSRHNMDDLYGRCHAALIDFDIDTSLSEEEDVKVIQGSHNVKRFIDVVFMESSDNEDDDDDDDGDDDDTSGLTTSMKEILVGSKLEEDRHPVEPTTFSTDDESSDCYNNSVGLKSPVLAVPPVDLVSASYPGIACIGSSWDDDSFDNDFTQTNWNIVRDGIGAVVPHSQSPSKIQARKGVDTTFFSSNERICTDWNSDNDDDQHENATTMITSTTNSMPVPSSSASNLLATKYTKNNSMVIDVIDLCSP
jgi:predicted GIY-YIG superfamily endonuclease